MTKSSTGLSDAGSMPCAALEKESFPISREGRMSQASMYTTFKRHLEQDVKGFSFNGITISYKFGMELAYPILSAFAVVVLPILQQKLHLEDTALKDLTS